MISVDQALSALFELVTPTGTETVPLKEAHGRVFAGIVFADRDQPPFSASAMDGYAVRKTDVKIGAQWSVVGEAAAGHSASVSVNTGEAVRIFTGAPMPDGTDHVIIQENVLRNGDNITLINGPNESSFVRPSGADFKQSDAFSGPRLLRPSDIALLASMNVEQVCVALKPIVAILPTGDELVQPGERPGPNQIIASNSLGLAAMLAEAGASPRLLPIARDRLGSLSHMFEIARDADLIVTIGGASVGDHDLVAQAAKNMGVTQSFYKVAMRPGKPLMSGAFGTSAMVGLPGNPVSAMVCGEVFLKPMIDRFLGLPALPRKRFLARLSHNIAANGPREHYMRAVIDDGEITIFDRQDSALLTVLTASNALVVRAPNDPNKKKGTLVEYLQI